MDEQKNPWAAAAKAGIGTALNSFMEEHGLSPKASVQAVDAYKTYLYRKGTRSVKEIESVKPGQPIKLDDLESEIAALQKTIQTCKDLAFSTTEESNKLKGLLNLRTQLTGKVWPSHQDMTAEAEQAVQAQKKLLAAIAKEKLKAQQAVNQNIESFKQPTTVTYYQKQFLESLKQQTVKKWIPPVKPQEKMPVEIGAALGRFKIDQEWIMRIGVASNCQVSILQTNGGLGSETILRCKVCNATKNLDRDSVVSTNVLAEGVEDFCKTHRHDSPVGGAAPKGRLFRDE